MKNNRYLSYLIGLLLPPLGIYLVYGFSTTLAINILLTVIGWIPGSIHAVWAISKFEEKVAERAEREQRTV
ncbi:MAG: YqaE/Pmp3 family membrane protein [Acaryochloridaceae cyanobacterium RU_4_10]|nr:YqaE/Pmp3 family membrane protein [Acaryochloridaceae cyanobacterium RU_4_10]